MRLSMGFLLGFPWYFYYDFYDISMGLLWDFHWISVEFLWYFYMIGSLGISHGISRGAYGVSIGISMICLWDSMVFLFDGISMGFLCSKGFLWDFHGISLVFLWDFYWILWDFYGISMGFLWDVYSMGFL